MESCQNHQVAVAAREAVAEDGFVKRSQNNATLAAPVLECNIDCKSSLSANWTTCSSDAAVAAGFIPLSRVGAMPGHPLSRVGARDGCARFTMRCALRMRCKIAYIHACM